MSRKGAERARRRQRIARAPQDAQAHVVAAALPEPADEARLADAGLAADKRQPPGGLRLLEEVLELREQPVALDQPHARTLLPPLRRLQAHGCVWIAAWRRRQGRTGSSGRTARRR
jgi:hypothetical protein